MEEVYEFSPPQRMGVIYNSLFLLIMSLGGAWSILLATRTEVGALFLVYLLVGLVAISLAPAFAYRLRALLGASYILQRDGIRVKWGLRLEDIPVGKVLWVNHAHDMEPAVPLPLVYWPGSVLGTRKTKSGIVVEFFASRSTSLVLVATEERVFAISPEDPEGFVTTFNTLTQQGSLAALPAQSVFPSFLLARVWKDRPAQVILLGSLTLSLALLIWVGLTIPQVSEILFDLSPASEPPDFVPSVQLLLLPALNAIFLGANFLLGLFFYRRADPQAFSEARGSGQPGGKPLAYLLWGSSILTSLLFLGAVFFILRASSL